MDERLRTVESRMPGHTDDEIVQMIDERLAHFADTILPDVMRKALHDELLAPLKRVDESIAASKANRTAIAEVQKSVDGLKQSTDPIIEIHAGLRFIRNAILSIGGIVLMVAAVAAIGAGWLS